MPEYVSNIRLKLKIIIKLRHSLAHAKVGHCNFRMAARLDCPVYLKKFTKLPEYIFTDISSHVFGISITKNNIRYIHSLVDSLDITNL